MQMNFSKFGFRIAYVFVRKIKNNVLVYHLFSVSQVLGIIRSVLVQLRFKFVL